MLSAETREIKGEEGNFILGIGGNDMVGNYDIGISSDTQVCHWDQSSPREKEGNHMTTSRVFMIKHGKGAKRGA